MTNKQIANEVRKLLRYAGYMNRVRTEWLANQIGCKASDIIDSIPYIETKTFKLYRQSGQGCSLAMA